MAGTQLSCRRVVKAVLYLVFCCIQKPVLLQPCLSILRRSAICFKHRGFSDFKKRYCLLASHVGGPCQESVHSLCCCRMQQTATFGSHCALALQCPCAVRGTISDCVMYSKERCICRHVCLTIVMFNVRAGTYMFQDQMVSSMAWMLLFLDVQVEGGFQIKAQPFQ